MKVLIDTSVWSAALRKQVLEARLQQVIFELSELINTGRAAIIGVIRQEILSGIKSHDQFKKLKSYLRAFPDVLLETQDYELAAQLFNQCRSKGIQGSHIDFLIAAATVNREMLLFTLDDDFRNYLKYVPIKLFEMRVS